MGKPEYLEKTHVGTGRPWSKHGFNAIVLCILIWHLDDEFLTPIDVLFWGFKEELNSRSCSQKRQAEGKELVTSIASGLPAADLPYLLTMPCSALSV